jgi:CheY-like chemotaxis protein
LSDFRVLIVDDDPAIREVLSGVLSLEGYAIATATNGLEALEVTERMQPALILLDMRMPVLDGWGFARELGPRRQGLKILVMTAAEDAGRWADEINADGYLPKPFEIDTLLDEVHRLCPVGARSTTPAPVA